MEPTVINRNYYSIIIIISYSFLLCSCSSLNKCEDIDAIVKILIRNSVEGDMLYNNKSQKIKDMLFIDDKFVVATYPEMNPILKNFALRKNQVEFNSAFFQLKTFNEKKKLNFNSIKIFEDVMLTEFTPELKVLFEKNKVYGTFHKVVLFSRIAIENNMALVVFSEAGSPLDGSSVLYYLKKENDKWNIFDQQLLSIS